MGWNVYACSDGTYYGDVQLWNRLESGTWSPCCWDVESGQEWVTTADGDLLVLTPVSRTDLPEGATVERVAGGVVVTGDRELPDRMPPSGRRSGPAVNSP